MWISYHRLSSSSSLGSGFDEAEDDHVESSAPSAEPGDAPSGTSHSGGEPSGDGEPDDGEGTGEGHECSETEIEEDDPIINPEDAPMINPKDESIINPEEGCL